MRSRISDCSSSVSLTDRLVRALGADDPAALLPAPAALEELAARHWAAGLHVTMEAGLAARITVVSCTQPATNGTAR